MIEIIINRYNPANDGRYVGSNDGKYVHVAGKDGPGSPGYVGGGGQYSGGSLGGGQYSGGLVGGGQYSGNAGARNSNSGRIGSSGLGTTPSPKPAAVTAAQPKEGWQIIRNEKSETDDGYHYL